VEGTDAFTLLQERFHLTHSATNELKRYGLLALRHLEALQVKIGNELAEEATGVTVATLQGWDLDVDQARLAWDGLLKEEREIQARLQQKVDEKVLEYKLKIQQAASPEERLKLEVEKRAELGRLAAASPLPLRLPTEVSCPSCSLRVVVSIGPTAGEVATTTCRRCGVVFHANRATDGSIFVRKYGESARSTVVGQIRPETHLSEMKVVAQVFASAAEGKVQNWSEFKTKVQAGLAAGGLDPKSDGRIHTLLFRLKAFRLYGVGNGIGLVVSPERLVSFIEERIAEVSGVRDVQALNAILYNGNEERLAALQALIERLSGAAPLAVTER